MRSLTHCQAWIERIMHVQHAEVKRLVYIYSKQDLNVTDISLHLTYECCCETFMFLFPVNFLTTNFLFPYEVFFFVLRLDTKVNSIKLLLKTCFLTRSFLSY